MKTKTNKKRIPKLRFPKFSGVWNEKKLGEVCEYKNGGSFESTVVKNGKYNLITLNSIDISGKLKNDHKTVNSADWFLQQNDLIMVLSDVAHGNFLGLVDIIPENNKYVLNQRMGLLRKIDDKVDLRFLCTYINKNQQYFKLHGQGSSQQNLSKGDIQKFKINLPSLPEQQKIAGFLGKTDEWIENLNTQKELLESYKKGIMQKIFSQKICFKDNNGKDFPDWEEKKLGEVCEVITKGTTPTSLGYKYQNEGINFIKVENISRNFFIDINLTPKISQKCDNDLKRSRLRKNDILFSIAGTLGRTAVVKDKDLPANTNQAVSIIRLNDSENVSFVNYFLNSILIKKRIKQLLSIGAQPNLSLEQVGSFNINFPSLPEQQKIANFLTSLDKGIELKQQQITQAKQWKKGLMQGLFV